LWALRSVGVRQVLAPGAVGSLRPELDPGTFVVPDQIIDRTYGRGHSVYEGTGKVFHVPFADPYCPRLRSAFLAAASAETPLVDGGTLVVVNGPRFSTKAESKMNAQAGGTVVGMTGMPEAVIARELAMCYSTVSMVTDHDAGVDGHEPVTNEQVIAVFEKNLERLKMLLRKVITQLDPEPNGLPNCSCRQTLDGFITSFPLP
jgi:5'-methylthioadenosine phosphorylase